MTLLHRKLAGNVVLNATADDPMVGAFAYCAEPATNPAAAAAAVGGGGVTLVLVNFDVNGSKTVEIGKAGLNVGGAELFSLFGLRAPLPPRPAPADIIRLVTSTDIYLNGASAPLRVSASGGVGIKGASVGGTVALPGLGVAFVSLPNANATACVSVSNNLPM